MDAKTIDKVVTKAQGEYLFGRRSFVEVSIPIAKLGCEPPPEPRLGKPGAFMGYWTSKEGGLTVMTVIHQVWSRKRPRATKNGFKPLFVERESVGGLVDYSWWRGEKRFFKGKPSSETLVRVEPLDPRIVTAYKAHLDWLERYGGHRETGIKAFDAFVEAALYAKTVKAGLRGGRLVLQFIVKYFQPATRKGFVRALTKAMRLSDKLGFGAELVALAGGGAS
jgi:hypothetical protein